METTTQPQPSGKPPAHMLNEVGNFIRQYLVCSDYQAVILTAWVLHTWCYRAFPVTPYLNLQSPGPQCGKTRCLQLLRLLSPPGSWFTSAPAPNLFIRRLLALKPAEGPGQERSQDVPSAVFLDDREFTIGSSDRRPIVPFLNSGSRASDRYLYQVERSSVGEFSVFCPKAFAGVEPLPRSLAARCLFIQFQRKKATEKVEPLDLQSAAHSAKPLIAWMQQWSAENCKRLAARAHLWSMELSPAVTAIQQELAKPLLLIADCVGGKWLENVSNSFRWLFLDRDVNALSDGLLLLADLRGVFQEFSNPAYLATRDLVPCLRGLDYRPWNQWGKAPEFYLSQLLRPFGVSSKPQRINPDSVIKVYRCQDLEEAWARYL